MEKKKNIYQPKIEIPKKGFFTHQHFREYSSIYEYMPNRNFWPSLSVIPFRTPKEAFQLPIILDMACHQVFGLKTLTLD